MLRPGPYTGSMIWTKWCWRFIPVCLICKYRLSWWQKTETQSFGRRASLRFIQLLSGEGAVTTMSSWLDSRWGANWMYSLGNNEQIKQTLSVCSAQFDIDSVFLPMLVFLLSLRQSLTLTWVKLQPGWRLLVSELDIKYASEIRESLWIYVP